MKTFSSIWNIIILKDCGRENEMEELVGFCTDCGKPIYCLNGFLNGVVIDGKGTIYCFHCHKNIDNNCLEKNDK
jgi:hypothetical protein